MWYDIVFVSVDLNMTWVTFRKV